MTISLDLLLRSYRDGDEHGWETEFAWLEEHHPQKIAELMDDIHAVGIQEPILLGSDGRIWDGHHRIYAAHRLGLKRVPVVRSDDA
ncbi:ParB N-terminal domain-containing protein [Microbacterium plantarum]|uniref:ParB N-terminal domain-containing protein n=1 Tax=Microbacterium plantarum TaxID=1816425 RepID=UPI002B477BCE|nr:ParB N-terminal domain-containing protein [Microbacterium plantarum]WRK16512.1 ParB N-terminal domain-containing protein [Microbacterium plantarum]